MVNKKIIITSVCWYKIYPTISGGQNGIALFLNALANLFPIQLICSKDNNATVQFDVHAILTKGKKQLLLWKNYRSILQLVKKQKTSHLIIEHPYYFLLAFFKKKYNYQFIVHTHNIEYKRAKLLGKWNWFLIYIIERIAYRNADFIFCKTVEDADFISQRFSVKRNTIHLLPYCSNIATLPNNALQAKEFVRKEHHLLPEEKIILFAASLNYMPNQKALLHLIKDVYPYLVELTTFPFKILLCGWQLTTFLKEHQLDLPQHIINAGLVEDINLYFKAADVMANTVVVGEGVQTKNIDAIANNCNVVIYEKMGKGLPKDLLQVKAFTVPNGDSLAFAKLIREVLLKDTKPTPKSFYENLSWNIQVKRIFDEILSISNKSI